MLKKILDPKCCAKCRFCCVFDRYDAWETPVFTEEQRDRIRAFKPDTPFAVKDGGFILRVSEFDENGLFTCPALTETGCMLGDDKPFDCRIWPYRIMYVGGRRAIVIASNCEEMFNRPACRARRLSEKWCGRRDIRLRRPPPRDSQALLRGLPCAFV